MPTEQTPPLQPLAHRKVVSLALNLPGPAALMRLSALGASCLKIDPPSGDPMQTYSPHAHTELHRGIATQSLNLKAADGLEALHQHLHTADVLLTSFRPSALHKLGLGWERLHERHPQLILVEIVGAPGQLAEVPGHDLTYMAEQGLVNGLELPPTLFADMGGALLACEAVLAALLLRGQTGMGSHHQVALSDASAWLGLPRTWHLTTPRGDVGGGHAGYRVYPCQDGRVAVAALEPHFAKSLCQVAGLPPETDMRSPLTASHLASFLAQKTQAELTELAEQHDLPLCVLPTCD